MNVRTKALLMMVAPIGVLLALSGGCGSKAPDPVATAKTNAAQATAIDENPNIPPQAKAALEQTVQGKNAVTAPQQAAK